MIRLLRGLGRRLQGRYFNSEVAALAAKLEALDQRAQKKKDELRALDVRLTSIADELLEDWKIERLERENIKAQLDELKRNEKRAALEIERLRSEMKVKDSTIDNLVAANQMLREEINAYMAIQVRKQVASE